MSLLRGSFGWFLREVPLGGSVGWFRAGVALGGSVLRLRWVVFFVSSFLYFFDGFDVHYAA